MKVLAIFLIVGLLGFTFFHQAEKQYDNVLGDVVEPTSTMPLAYASVKGTPVETKEKIEGSQSTETKKAHSSEQTTATKAREKNEPRQSEPSKSRTTTEKGSSPSTERSTSTERADRAGKSSPSQQRTASGTGKESKTKKDDAVDETKGTQKSDTSTAKTVVTGKEDTNPYFTTSIQDGETVTKSTYGFTITHKKTPERVLQTAVLVNDIPVESFDGQVSLQQGANQIVIRVTYGDEEKEDAVVERQYTVYYEENQLVLHTNLDDGMETTTKRIEFMAKAMFNERTYEADVLLDGEELAQNDEYEYVASLNAGMNEFTIRATLDGETVEKKYRVTYVKKQQRIQFETDLKNAQVSNAELFFTATAFAGNQQLDLEATLNGTPLEEVNDTYYDLLQNGKNTVELRATLDGETERETYTIYYTEPEETTNQTVPDDEDGPKIVTDLTNGLQMRGSIRNLMIWATDASGKKLPASGVAVTVNGKGAQMIWADSEKISYKLKLAEGKNTVTVKAWDSKGRIATKTYTVYAKNIDEGKVIGTATISVEATTVGLGKLIPDTEVELHEGERGSYVLEQLLRKNGFTYRNDGTLDVGFYLKSISKENMNASLRVPSDLEKIVQKHAEYYNAKSYTPNTLGEFDISNGSGWMYSINGDYPNYSMADAYFLDGDVIRLRYTLFYGNDINGGAALGNGSNEGNVEDNEWTKEW